jgi:exosortase B
MNGTASHTLRAPNLPASAPSKAELIAVALGLLALYVPTYIQLDQTIWNIVGQGHGPVMLALTIWLAYQRWPQLMQIAPEPQTMWGGVCIAIAFAAYFVGRSQDILLLDVGSQIWLLAGLLLMMWGPKALKLMWFPLFFIIFLIPLPSPLVDALTAPLKSAVSYAAENILFAVGYPIGRSGVTLTIGPYQLMVADACAGLNSVFALEAVGVFYLSITNHTSRARSLWLAVLILPISFIANVIRVISLVLITYYFGDEAGQGFVHEFAGIILFAVATLLTIGVDSILGIFFPDKPKPASPQPVA